MNIWQKIRDLFAYEPAVLAWALNGGVATVLAFLVHLGPLQVGAVTTITTALAALWTAVRSRPVSLSLLTGALATIATASAAFGLHLSAAVIGLGVTALSAVLGLLFRANVTPTAAVAAFATGGLVSPAASSARLTD